MNTIDTIFPDKSSVELIAAHQTAPGRTSQIQIFQSGDVNNGVDCSTMQANGKAYGK